MNSLSSSCPSLVQSLFFLYTHSSSLLPPHTPLPIFSFPGVPNQTYLSCSTTTGPRSSSVRMDASAPGAVTARGKWIFRCRMIVGMPRWMSWQGRGDGCAVLDLVRFVQALVFISWSDTGVPSLQSYGGEECRMRPYHLSVWNVSRSIKAFCTRKGFADTCS